MWLALFSQDLLGHDIIFLANTYYSTVEHILQASLGKK